MDDRMPWGVIITCVLLLVLALGGGLVGCPSYNVYSKEMRGKADYTEAVQNRRIKTLEAEAAAESAVKYAEAEVARAKGTEAANEIMQRSMGGPENYLRWRYIHMLEETAGKGDRTVIYVPTEATQPILTHRTQ